MLVATISIVPSEISNAGEAAAATVVNNGFSRFEILTDSGAPDGVREAAAELQRVIAKATGVRLQIVHAPTPRHREIVVGGHAYARKLGITDAGLLDDSYRMTVVKGDIFLIGKDDTRQPFYMLNNDQTASAGSYFAAAPAAPAPASQDGLLLLVPRYHVFGSEELSMLAPGVAERSPSPSIALSPGQAEALGLKEGQRARVTTETGAVMDLPVIIRPLPAGVAAAPYGSSGLTGIALPALVRIARSGA